MPIVVFRSRLRAGDITEFQSLAERMYGLAQTMPGFVSYKVFVAADDERCSIIEFDTSEHLEAWRRHPEHIDAMGRGRDAFYEEYSLRVCEIVRESGFAH